MKGKKELALEGLAPVARRFFEKFELFAEAPGPVGRLRELIRTLAVRGDLIPQDQRDEKAEDLIKRVVARLPGDYSSNPFLSGVEPSILSESEYDLPSRWAWIPLGCVGIWATGFGFPKQYQGATEGEFLFCKVSDMNLPGNEIEIRATVNSIDTTVMRKIRARSNPVGTVIFPKIGGAIATHKRRLVIKPTIIDNNCSGIQPIGLTESRWLLLLMRSIDLTRYQTGTSVPAVSQGSLDPIRIGLPPLAEQKRIVAKVAELMALCDRLEAQQQERDSRHAALARASLARFEETPTPANLNFLFHRSYAIDPADLRRAILSLAVRGKLVAQDPGDEPATALAARIANLRRARHAAEYPAVSDDESPYRLPPSWLWIRLGNISLGSDSGWSPQCLPERRSGAEWGVLKVSSVSWGEFRPDENKALPPGFAVRADCEVRAGDFLLSRANTEELVARSVIVGKTPPHLMMSDKIVRFTLPNEIEKSFVNLANSSAPSRAYYAKNASGTSSSMKNVGREVMCNLPIPLPPLAEQRRIVAKVDQLMNLVDQLEAEVAASRAVSASLLEALVAELTAAPGN